MWASKAMLLVKYHATRQVPAAAGRRDSVTLVYVLLEFRLSWPRCLEIHSYGPKQVRHLVFQNTSKPYAQHIYDLGP